MCSNWLYLKRQQTLIELSSVNISKYSVLWNSGPSHSSWVAGPRKRPSHFIHSFKRRGLREPIPSFWEELQPYKQFDTQHSGCELPWILVLDLLLTDLWSVDFRFLIHERWVIMSTWRFLWTLELVYLKPNSMYLNTEGPREIGASNFTKPLDKPSL